MSKPSILYKYRSLDGNAFRYTQDIVLRNRLYLPNYTDLNDPTEGVYRHKAKIVRTQEGAYVAEHSPLRHPSSTIRVLSMSANPKHPLMWSHYSDAHRGICIGFRRERLESRCAFQAVHYHQRVPTVLVSAPPEIKALAGFLSKSLAWSYEHEWRLVASNGTQFLKFPAGAIAVVIFGVRTSEDDKQWVLDWLRISNSQPQLKVAEFSGHAAKMHLKKFIPN